MSHAPFWALETPQMGFLGETQERAYNLNDKYPGVCIIPSFINITYLCDQRTPSIVRGQCKDILEHFSPKMYFRLISDNVLLVALKMVTIVVIIARHVPWVNLLCFGGRKLHRDNVSRHYRIKMSNSPADNWPKVEESFKLWYKHLISTTTPYSFFF